MALTTFASDTEATVVVDPDGDLKLRASTTSFKVCSATLRRSSPVWKAMLFGSREESKPTKNAREKWLIELPEDPPAALKIVLAIVHMQVDTGPSALEIPLFADILVLSDKYDMRKVIWPWIFEWVGEVGWDMLPVGSVEQKTLHGSWGSRSWPHS
jgi:hypothetical protein